jgi:hypothetical protein
MLQTSDSSPGADNPAADQKLLTCSAIRGYISVFTKVRHLTLS